MPAFLCVLFLFAFAFAFLFPLPGNSLFFALPESSLSQLRCHGLTSCEDTVFSCLVPSSRHFYPWLLSMAAAGGSQLHLPWGLSASAGTAFPEVVPHLGTCPQPIMATEKVSGLASLFQCGTTPGFLLSFRASHRTVLGHSCKHTAGLIFAFSLLL